MNQLDSKNVKDRSPQFALQRRHCIAVALTLAISGACGIAAAAAPGAKSGPVLVLGDSLSAEYGLTRGKGWVQLLQQRMNDEKNPRKVVNASISGETTAGGRARLASLLRQHEPGIVILELGGNDALRGLALQSTQQNLEVMIKAAKEAGAQVLLVGMQVPPNYGATYTEQFAGMFKKVADTQKLPLVPFLLSGIGDAADAEQWFQSDRIHPNAQAQPQMLANVWPKLRPLLK
ncbi:arylesterase [Comamonas testosteroni]|jgi:acyl-CoA thioesterase-1|nr:MULTISPECIES: arylesterase [Comamonas]EED66715.1 lipolytic protein G-D-S-L family [Comamonas testosteroni KF-1]MPS87470.1 arylesterase [Comamonas sp.]WQG64933.1 arylesterase [Comamonas testosteroni]